MIVCVCVLIIFLCVHAHLLSLTCIVFVTAVQSKTKIDKQSHVISAYVGKESASKKNAEKTERERVD